jgi:hypothetical protein
MIPMKPIEILTAFDQFLTGRGLRLDAVVVGGAALNLLGVISRPTKDCDILAPTLSHAVVEAAVAFATAIRRDGVSLDDDWLNNGPASLTEHLPKDWRGHLQIAFSGQAITLTCLGRLDLLRAKLWALADRGIDLGDCVALAPNDDELKTILPWLEQQDANPDWPAHVRDVLADLGRRLGHGV